MNTQRIVICAALFSFTLSACEQNNSTGGNSPQAAPAQTVAETPVSSAPGNLTPVNSAMETKTSGTALPPGHVPVTAPGTATATAPTNAFNNTFSGEVLETFDASTFTYVQIKTDNGSVWAAGPITAVKKGDTVSFGGQTPMENFHSKSLNRTFEMIYFANSLSVNGAAVAPLSEEKAASVMTHSTEE